MKNLRHDGHSRRDYQTSECHPESTPNVACSAFEPSMYFIISSVVAIIVPFLQSSI